jgi:hypothetical protein
MLAPEYAKYNYSETRNLRGGKPHFKFLISDLILILALEARDGSREMKIDRCTFEESLYFKNGTPAPKQNSRFHGQAQLLLLDWRVRGSRRSRLGLGGSRLHALQN